MNNNMSMFNVSSSNPNMMPINQMKAMMANNNPQQFPQMNMPSNFQNNSMPNNNMNNMNDMNNMNNVNNMNNNRQLNLNALTNPLVITGPTQGTSIASIKGVDPRQSQSHSQSHSQSQLDNRRDNRQYHPNNKQINYSQENPQMNNRSRQHNTQHPVAHDNMSHDSYASSGSVNSADVKNNEEIGKIKHLFEDINKHLDDFGPSKSQFSDESIDENSDSDIEASESSDKPTKTKQKETSSDIILISFKECVMIIILYILMSQDFIKKSVVSAIPQALDTSGNITYIGQITFGSMIAFCFIFFRKILL